MIASSTTSNAASSDNGSSSSQQTSTGASSSSLPPNSNSESGLPTPYTSPGTTTSSTRTSTSACVTASPLSPACPAANGTLYTPAGLCVGSEDTFVIFCGGTEAENEYVSDGLIRLDDVTTLEACVEQCSLDANCQGAAFDTTDNSCYQKNSAIVGTFKAKPTMIITVRAVKYPSGTFDQTATSISTFASTVFSSSSLGSVDSVSTSSRSSAISSQTPLTTTSSTLDTFSTAYTTSSQIGLSSSSGAQSSIGTSTSLTGLSSTIITLTGSASTSSDLASSISSAQSTSWASSISTMSVISSSSTTASGGLTDTTGASSTLSETPDSSSLEPSSITSSSGSTSVSSESSSTGNDESTSPSSSFSVGDDSATESSMFVTTSSSSYTSASDTSQTSPIETTSQGTSAQTTSDLITTSSATEYPTTTLEEASTSTVSTDLTQSDLVTTFSSASSPSSTTSIPTTESSSESYSISSVPASESNVSSSQSEISTSQSSTLTLVTSSLDESTSSSFEVTTSSSASSSLSASSSSAPEPPISETLSQSETQTSTSSTSLEQSSPSSTWTSTSSIPPVPSSSTIYSSSTSSATPRPSPLSCENESVFTSTNGREYTVYCHADTAGTGGGEFDTINFLSGDFDQCAAACDERGFPTCEAWVWAPPAEPGNFGGACFLKRLPQGPIPGSEGMVAGIIIDNQTPSPSPPVTLAPSTSSELSSETSSFLSESSTETTSTESFESSTEQTSSSESSTDPPTNEETSSTMSDVDTSTSSSSSFEESSTSSLEEPTTSSNSLTSSDSSSSTEISSTESSSSSEAQTTTTTTSFDETTTTTTTTTTSESSTTSSSTPSPTCMVEDQSVSTTVDDSQFIVLCNRDYVRSDLIGIDASQANDFESCLELCADQGTACAGIIYEITNDPSVQCRLQSRMQPLATSATGIASAVRVTGEGGTASRQQPVQNGGFDTNLDPWFSTTTDTGQRFAFHDNAARALFDLTSGPARLRARQAFRGDSLILEQDFPQPITGNLAYYLSFDLGFELIPPGQPGQVQCQIYAQNGLGDLYTNLVVYVANGVNKLYGSGTSSGSFPRILINVYCSGSADFYVIIDNFIFDIYPTTGGTTPETCNNNQQIIQNSNFNFGLDPWTFSQRTSTSAEFSFFGDRARVAFSALRGSSDDPVEVSQAISVPAGTRYTAYVDVYYTVPILGSCSFDLRNDMETLYFSGQIFENGWIPITTSGTFEIGATALVLRIDCFPGNSHVDFDNVYLYLNPGPDCPPPSNEGPAQNEPPIPPIR
ncbi:hypothetical protein Q7P37_003299 [Cladosporium fusiforme]